MGCTSSKVKASIQSEDLISKNVISSQGIFPDDIKD